MDDFVDLSKIANSLVRAKKVIDGDNTNNPKGQMATPTQQIMEKEMPSMNYSSKNDSLNNLSPDAIKNSKLPDEIKESLLNDPINVSMNRMSDEKFDELVKKVNPKTSNNTQRINEEVLDNKIGLTETQVRGIVKDELMKFFSKEMVKVVAEQIITKLKKPKK